MDDDALDQLYAGDFDGFVARRDALAKQLRADGDREAADEVKALKKPNQPAWALNQLSTKQRDRLLKAGQALREAQEQVVAGDADPDDLRAATDAERTAVSEALGAATALAEKDGTALSEAATERARQTLHAVALDEEVRGEFERGRLTTDHDAPGLGELVLGGATPSPKGKARKKKQSAERDQAKQRREEVKSAEAEAKKLNSRREDAEREVEAARKEAQRAQHALERATEQLETGDRRGRGGRRAARRPAPLAGVQAPEAHSVTPSSPAKRFTSCVLMLRSSRAAARICSRSRLDTAFWSFSTPGW